jgi:hypothetical protein
MAIFTNDWTETEPTDATNSTDIDNWFRRLATAIRERFAIDHNVFADEAIVTGVVEAEFGMHKQVSLLEKSADPDNSDGGITLYDKLGRLFYRKKTGDAIALDAVDILAKTADYTLILTDANKVITMDVATANTLTVPKNSAVAFPIGTKVVVYQLGAGATTITPVDADVTITMNGTGVIAARYGHATLLKTATNTWLMLDAAQLIDDAIAATVNTMMILEETKPAGTMCGTFTKDTWVQRAMDLEQFNNVVGGSIGSGNIILPAGTFLIEASAPARDVNQHKLKFRRTTNTATDVIIGMNAAAYNSDWSETRATLCGVIVNAEANTFQLLHRCLNTSRDTAGLGDGVNIDSTTEIYSVVKITKIG